MSSHYIKQSTSPKTRLIMLWRVFKVGIRNLFRNAWLTVAAIAVMVVALTIILVALVLNVTARDVISHLSQDLKTSIYLHDNAPEKERQALQAELEAAEYIAHVDYVTKEEAQRRFMESFRDDEQLLAGLTLAGSDTLPSSFEVSTADLARMPDIERIAKRGQYKEVVESVTLGKTDARRTIDRAASIQGFVTRASIVAAAVFTVVSVLIIFNTIRMALFTRSEEIRIMKLIGATPGYIRGPFLVEASLYGVIAGVIAATTVYSAIASVGPKIATQEEFATTYQYFAEPSTIAMIFLGAILAGIVVGLFSSALAIKRHLKLKNW
jgi:cell division transport system permease protein